ncbi:MAG: hypothetical protein U5R46_17945 [Gammaproteobacteria bacterium]|nr:hypothetical protein [Gammaproteobacteria bacterium]
MSSAQVSTLDDRASTLLNKWYQQGTAAGNYGDYYDNRDRGHSRLSVAHYPQLRAVTYLPPEIEQNRDRGLQKTLLPFPAIGNSSMASAPTGAGSLPRIYYTAAEGVEFLHKQYRANNLYVYPEHRDHDPATAESGGYGDLYPTNTPYLVISQGSSGSDQPFVRALVKTLAAFQPGVKSALIRTGLLMPTLQRVFRRSNLMVRTRGDYLSGAAHPSAFDSAQLNTPEMVRRAHSITRETIPPLVRLDVVRDEQPVQGVDYFEPSAQQIDETLADTPCVVARIVRGRRYVRSITVSAGRSIDVNGRKLEFHWKVLRGDASRIQIDTRGATRHTARISVPYHHRRPIASGSALESSRVDIGVFAESDAAVSAPCFVTFYSLPNEERVYDEQGQILEINYRSQGREAYADPRLTASKGWRDVYRYEDDGSPMGWRRHLNGEWIDFTAKGERVLERDSKGDPVKVVPVAYVIDDKSGRLTMVPAD